MKRQLSILVTVVALLVVALWFGTINAQASQISGADAGHSVRNSGPTERLGPTQPVPPDFKPIDTPYNGGIVQDGSFEAGSPNPFWSESSTNFGTPLCTVAACGTGTGTGPRTGEWWAWFGGIPTFEEGSVSQVLTIPSGANTLEFYLEQFVCDSASDYLEVTIDGNQLFLTDGGSTLCGQFGYTLQSVDISAYADGGSHTLEFHSEIFANNGNGTNFFVDDVAIIQQQGATPTPTQPAATATATPPTTSIQLGEMSSTSGSPMGGWLIGLLGLTLLGAGLAYQRRK